MIYLLFPSSQLADLIPHNSPDFWYNTRMRVRIVIADITKQEVDAIVNAANVQCLGGSGYYWSR